MIQILSTVMQLFKGSRFSMGAASRHLWPISVMRLTVQRMYFIAYEFCFTSFKAEYKTYIFFKGLQMKR